MVRTREEIESELKRIFEETTYITKDERVAKLLFEVLLDIRELLSYLVFRRR